MEHTPDRWECSFHLVDSIGAFDLTTIHWGTAHQHPASDEWPRSTSIRGEMIVHHDLRRDLWLVEAEGHLLVVGTHSEPQAVPTVRELGRLFAPPTAWIGAAIVGLTLAAIAFVIRSRAARRVEAGLQRGVVDAATAERNAHDAVAFTVVIVAAVPLLVAAASGSVF